MLLLAISVFLNTNIVYAQLAAYSGKQSDNQCNTVYLVNPSSDIFYVAGLEQNELSDCRTFNSIVAENGRLRISVNINSEKYLLLLPGDTIAYKILVAAADNDKQKELSLLVRRSSVVLRTNNDRKRLRQIRRLPQMNVHLPIVEK